MTEYFPRELRELSFVPRWSIARTLRQQSVAEHMYFVAVYAKRAMDMLHIPFSDPIRQDVLNLALSHDMEEAASGDMPGPIKRRMKDNASQYLIEYVNDVMKQRPAIKSSKVKAIVKFADRLEAVMFVAQEMQMGNRTLGRFPDASNWGHVGSTAFAGRNFSVAEQTMHRLWEAFVLMLQFSDLQGIHDSTKLNTIWREFVWSAILENAQELSHIPQEP